MNALRHAAGWLAVIGGAAFATAAFWPSAGLQLLQLDWASQLAGWVGPERAIRIAATVPAGSLPGALALRASTLLACLWLLVPLWLAAALQGWLVGDVRRTSFAATNPVVHALSLHAAIAVAGALLLALALPLHVPVASVPAAGVLLSLLLGVRFAHRAAWRG